MELHNPHDSLFKRIFADTKAAKEIFQKTLPRALSDDLKYETLKLENVSHIDPKLKSYESDLVFSCQLKSNEKVYLSFILEHKSYRPKFPHVQLLRYLVGGYEAEIEADSKLKKLTPIIPVIIYHGKESWKYRPFSDYFHISNTVLKEYIPNFEFPFLDLKNWSDEEIKALQVGFSITTLLLIKHKSDKNYLLNFSKETFIFVNDFERENETAAANVQSIIFYAYKAFGLSKEEIMSVINAIPEEKQEKFKSAYDVIFEEGEALGLAYSKLFHKVEFVLKLHKEAPIFNIEQLVKITGVDKSLVEVILQKIVKNKKEIATKTIKKLFEPIKEIKKQDLQALLKLAQV